jgi:hypothetical protein
MGDIEARWGGITFIRLASSSMTVAEGNSRTVFSRNCNRGLVYVNSKMVLQDGKAFIQLSAYRGPFCE